MENLDAFAHIAKIDLQILFDAIPFYVMLVDGNHKILMANEAVRKDLGIDPEQIIGEYCPKVIHGMDEPHHRRILFEHADVLWSDKHYIPSARLRIKFSRGTFFENRYKLAIGSLVGDGGYEYEKKFKFFVAVDRCIRRLLCFFRTGESGLQKSQSRSS